jgi:hypothetical protein
VDRLKFVRATKGEGAEGWLLYRPNGPFESEATPSSNTQEIEP